MVRRQLRPTSRSSGTVNVTGYTVGIASMKTSAARSPVLLGAPDRPRFSSVPRPRSPPPATQRRRRTRRRRRAGTGHGPPRRRPCRRPRPRRPCPCRRNRDPPPPAASPAPAREATAVAGSIPPPPEPAAEAPPGHRDRHRAAARVCLSGAADARSQVRLALARPSTACSGPILPAKAGRERFVVGISGVGLARHRLREVCPLGRQPQHQSEPDRLLEAAGAHAAAGDPDLLFRRLFRAGAGRARRHRRTRRSRARTPAAPTPTISGCASGSGTSGTSRSVASRAGRSFTSAWAWIRTRSSVRARSGPGESAYPISYYGLTDNEFRPQGAAGNLAFHYYPLPFLRFEILGMAGSLSGPTIATRPVAIIDFGWLKLKGGVEWQRITGQNVTDRQRRPSKGVGGAIQFVFEPHVEFGLNAAQGTVVSIDMTWQGHADRDPYTRTSYGGFANVSNGSDGTRSCSASAGCSRAMSTRTTSPSPTSSTTTGCGKASPPSSTSLFQQLYIKLVAGYSRGHWLTAAPIPATSSTTRCTASGCGSRSTSRPPRRREKTDAQSKHPGWSDSGRARGPRPRARLRAARAAGAAPQRRLEVGLAVLPMGLGKLTLPIGATEVTSDASFAYGVGLSVSRPVIAGFSLGLVPQVIFNVQDKVNPSQLAAPPTSHEFDSMARIAYTIPLVEGSRLYLEALPGYSLIAAPHSLAMGAVVVFGAGLAMDMSERSFVNLGAGYQFGFQAVNGGDERSSRYLRVELGGGVRF